MTESCAEQAAVHDWPFDEMVYLRAQQLLAMDTKELERQARDVSAAHPEKIEASPVILTGNCTTRPICRHCKWRHFKATKRDPFILDATEDTVRARMHQLAEQGVGRAFLATGWMGYRLPERFVRMVSVAREAEPSIELFGLFGALDRESHLELARAGLSGMLTGIESPSEKVYRTFRPGGDSLADRLRSFSYVREAGMKLWTGFLVGLGETADDVARGIALIAPWKPESVSILPFEPYPDTEMADCPPTDPVWLERAVAAGRICLPGTTYFFTDRAGGLGSELAQTLSLNGTYRTGRRSGDASEHIGEASARTSERSGKDA